MSYKSINAFWLRIGLKIKKFPFIRKGGLCQGFLKLGLSLNLQEQISTAYGHAPSSRTVSFLSIWKESGHIRTLDGM